MSEGIRWIIGLGNPGRRYVRSRHNAGFWVIDAFANRHAIEGSKRQFRADWSRGKIEVGAERADVMLVKPQTYMNLSGEAVRDLLGYFRTEREGDLKDRLLVVFDDLDLPEGRVRFRGKGSAGGHRGVASVIQCLGHDRFARLKIGVGQNERGDAADFVLEKLDADGFERFQRIASACSEMLSTWLEFGIEKCMNRFNASTLFGEDPEGEAAERV